MKRILFTSVATVAIVSCSAQKHEAASLVDAMSRFHMASNHERVQRATEVESVPCSRDVCAVKAICVRAVTLHSNAIRKKNGVAEALAQHDEIDAAALSKQLDEASQSLDESVKQLSSCDEKLRELRARFGLKR